MRKITLIGDRRRRARDGGAAGRGAGAVRTGSTARDQGRCIGGQDHHPARPAQEVRHGRRHTMVFRANDPAMLKAVKAGDKVKFEADRVNGQFTVMKIQKAK